MGAERLGPAGRTRGVRCAYPVHVEGGVRAGRADLAARPVAQFTAWAGAIGQRWATAVAARCAALTADDADAEPLWRGAMPAPQGGWRPVAAARPPPLYGAGPRPHPRPPPPPARPPHPAPRPPR